MSEIITVNMPGEKDDAGTFSIFLWNSVSGLLLNTGGDVLTRVENPTGTMTTLRQFTLAEARTADLIAVIYSGTAAVDAAALYDSFLLLTKTRVGEEAVSGELSLRGGLTLAEGVDLIMAGVLGVNSQPSATTEQFNFVDDDPAFVTTFDVSGNRASVVLS